MERIVKFFSRRQGRTTRQELEEEEEEEEEEKEFFQLQEYWPYTPVARYQELLEERRRLIEELLEKGRRLIEARLGGLNYTRLFEVDIREGTFVLETAGPLFERYNKRLALKSSIQDSHGTGNFELLYNELPKILEKTETKNFSNNVWCQLGNICIVDISDEVYNKEYTLPEVQSHLIEKKWNFLYSEGMRQDEFTQSVLDQLFSPLEQLCPPYWCYESIFHNPSSTFVVKVFFVIDEEKSSNGSQFVYKSCKCPHELHNVIKASDSSPYFYICEIRCQTSQVNIFEPSAPVDFCLITEANWISFSNEGAKYKDATILYEYIKKKLHISNQGHVKLSSQSCPEGFRCVFSQTSKNTLYRVNSPEGHVLTARLATYKGVERGKIELFIDNCSKLSPDEIIDQVPKLLNCARNIARKFPKTSDQSTIPPEILARGQQAQHAYEIALKSGTINNCFMTTVLVGPSRAGKTSLLRSLNGEKFNPSEDSTVGAELHRSLSRVDESDWEKNESKDHAVYNQCAAIAVAEHLQMKPAAPTNSDIEDRSIDANFQLEISFEEIHDKGGDPEREEVPQVEEDSQAIEHHPVQHQNTVKEVEVIKPKIVELPDEVATCIENILNNPDAVKEIESNLYLNTIDMAGQPVFSVTLPVFLPRKGIFLLVHSLANDLHGQATPIVKCGAAERIIDKHCSMTNMDHLKFWLSLVTANSTVEGGSRVFIVCTHADKPHEPDVKQTARKILQEITHHFAAGRNVVRDLYTVDNTVSGSERPKDHDLLKLRVRIVKEAKDLPQLKELIPIRWLHFRRKLNQLVNQEKTKYISHEDAIKIASECNIEVESNELSTLLNYLHDLKMIIYFPETNMVVIDPQWLLNMFAKVITVQPIEYHEGHEREWRDLEQKGILDVEFLEYLWDDVLDDKQTVPSLITIMEKFSLICEWKRKDESPIYLVPAMLMNTSGEDANELIKEDCRVPPLVVRFSVSHLPFGLFPRLLVAIDNECNSKWPGSSPPDLSRNFARFYINDTFSLVFISDIQTITVSLVNEGNVEAQMDPAKELCRFIHETLEKVLKKMLESFPWMKSLNYEFCFRCYVCEDTKRPCEKHNKSHCMRDPCVHLIPNKDFLEKARASPRCHKNATRQNVISADRYSCWLGSEENSSAICEIQRELDVLSLPSNSCEENTSKAVVAVNPGCLSLDKITVAAKKLAVQFNLDKNSVEKPPDDTIDLIRHGCRKIIAQGEPGKRCVEVLREELPSGMTGPLMVRHDVLVKDMNTYTKKKLSEALCAKGIQWKYFAKDKVGLDSDRVAFLDERTKDPVFEILETHCQEWTTEQLYDAIADCGAEAVADQYL